MRIPTYAVLAFSALLLVAVVNGANVTIGPTQGQVVYRVNINNQGTTVASFVLNESAQPTGKNGIVLVTANLLSTLRNFTYLRTLNTSSFPEVFPYLLGVTDQSLSYHAYGISLTLHIVSTGNAPITFNGQTYQGTSYRVFASANYPSTTAPVSANGTIITTPSGLIYSAVFFSSFIISAYMELIYTLTGKTIYKTIQIYLPTSPANSLPIQYASPLLPQTVGVVLQFVGSGNAIVPTLDLSVAILLAYTIPAIAIAAAYFWFADISRKMS